VGSGAKVFGVSVRGWGGGEGVGGGGRGKVGGVVKGGGG